MRNTNYPFFTIMFILAALWNALGAGFGYFNTEYTFQALFDRELHDPLMLEIYKGAWGTTLMFFIGYILVALDPIKHVGIAIIGAIGKFAFAVAELKLFMNDLANAYVLIIVIGDFIFCAFFLYYFIKIYKLTWKKSLL